MNRAQKFCGECGTPIIAEARFCGECGTAINTAVDNHNTKAHRPPYPPRSSKTKTTSDAQRKQAKKKSQSTQYISKGMPAQTTETWFKSNWTKLIWFLVGALGLLLVAGLPFVALALLVAVAAYILFKNKRKAPAPTSRNLGPGDSQE